MEKSLNKLLMFYIMAGILSIIIFQVRPVPTLAQTETNVASETGDDTGSGETGTGDTGTGDTGSEGDGTNTGDSDVDQEAPSFQNAAQAAHAANLADAAVQSDPEVQEAFDTVTEAEQNLDKARETGNETTIEEAQAAYDAAKADAENALAETTGTLTSDIAAMREEGMGWGQIAHELGVHPSVLGLGHTKRAATQSDVSVISGKTKGGKPETEIEMATTRNIKTGFGYGHGLSMGGKSGSKSLGLSYASASHNRKSDKAGSSFGGSSRGSRKGGGSIAGGRSGKSGRKSGSIGGKSGSKSRKGGSKGGKSSSKSGKRSGKGGKRGGKGGGKK